MKEDFLDGKAHQTDKDTLVVGEVSEAGRNQHSRWMRSLVKGIPQKISRSQDAEEEVKAVSTNKQKVEEVAAKQKALKVVKKEESSSEESSDEYEDEKPFAKAPAPSKKTPTKNGNVKKTQLETTSKESDSDDSSSSDEEELSAANLKSHLEVYCMICC
ncbi:hypothetical protein MTR_8g432580 [Medicago truncatula]|uniref:Uncharacterized protein n=1 Tax=Medicago truncatula TaxID=3880 RepID=A0A072TN86_MEDTR|nr:hypothetical protein MTR_8g432580 [Medicago truncatula]